MDELKERMRGAALVVRAGKVLWSHTEGYADLPNRTPNILNTRFASASAGKVFVAVGILQQIERGKLRLSDTLGKCLRLDSNTIDPLVTVEQLLTHTSGVPDYFDERVMDDYEALWADFPNYRIRRNADLCPLFINKPMLYPRGARFQYNNTGYVLLAMILEALTGMAFDEYLKKHVFDACRMEASGYFELDRLPAQCANSYIYCQDSDSYRTNIYSVDAKGTGAGGAFVTAPDIARFWMGLIGGKLLARETVDRMLSWQSGDGRDAEEGRYGYGVWIAREGTTDIPYFQGCDPGVSFLSRYNARTDTLCVLASNYGDDVWTALRQLRDAFDC